MTVQITQTAPPMVAGVADPYSAGKMIPSVHHRLVEDLDRIAREAGVSPRDVTGDNYALTPTETAYLREFNRTHITGKLGVIYIGQHDPSVLNRSRSIVGALLRNFITARLTPREVLINALFHGGEGRSADLVAVPDFHYQDAPAATRRALSSWVMDRVARGRQTVLGVPSQKVMSDLFGDAATDYAKHFVIETGYIKTSE